MSESAHDHVRVTLQSAEKLRLLDPTQGGDLETESGVVLKLNPIPDPTFDASVAPDASQPGSGGQSGSARQTGSGGAR